MTIAAKVLAELDRLTNNETPPNAVEIATWFALRLPSLRAALAPPQEGEVEACLAWLDAESAKDGDGDAWRYAQAARLLRATQNNGHSPVGDESPRQNAKGAEGCHDAPNASGESPAQSTPAQEGESTREQIDAGWVADLAYEDELKNAGYTHADRRERVRRILRAARLLRATQSNGRGAGTNVDDKPGCIGPDTPASPPAQSAPAQEPVAWRYKERINCGQGQYIDSDWKLASFRPMLGGSSDGGCSSGVTHLEPLYAAPPPPAPAQEPVATLEAKVSTLLARALTTGYGSTEAIYALANLAREPLYAAPPPDEARELLREADSEIERLIEWLRELGKHTQSKSIDVQERIRAYLARHK